MLQQQQNNDTKTQGERTLRVSRVRRDEEATNIPLSRIPHITQVFIHTSFHSYMCFILSFLKNTCFLITCTTKIMRKIHVLYTLNLSIHII